jgi:hypothetical protein
MSCPNSNYQYDSSMTPDFVPFVNYGALQTDLDAWLIHYNTEPPPISGDLLPGFVLAQRESLFRVWSFSDRLQYSRGVRPSRLVWSAPAEVVHQLG